MKETSKAHARRAEDPLFLECFRGQAIDIGGGTDPLQKMPEFPHLDVEFVIDRGGNHKNLANLDAEALGENDIFKDRAGRYDLVYSSQTLEHLPNPGRAVFNWWRLVKVGGHLVVTVPDFQLYEQGQWPHVWNSNHLTAWKLNSKTKEPDGSPGCIPLRELLLSLPNAEILKCAIEDTGYDYELLARIQNGDAEPCDQTMKDAEAWLEAVVRKTR